MVIIEKGVFSWTPVRVLHVSGVFSLQVTSSLLAPCYGKSCFIYVVSIQNQLGNCFHLALHDGSEYRNTAGSEGDFTSDFEGVK